MLGGKWSQQERGHGVLGTLVRADGGDVGAGPPAGQHFLSVASIDVSKVLTFPVPPPSASSIAFCTSAWSIAIYFTLATNPYNNYALEEFSF